ncbi:centlein [Antechinus flavipes]|uniref:centlein n=1 Tax=Antechinus flavipes TaxID=38775 RepID=UPI002236039E|nr:centlein [Antechinus flavipes]
MEVGGELGEAARELTGRGGKRAAHAQFEAPPWLGKVAAAGGVAKGPRPESGAKPHQAFPPTPSPGGRSSVEGASLDPLQLLEEELRSVREELCQCQADKEFVWSLWKRLHTANPDLTEAVSLVVEREKTKAEAKDRKVLEILQVKDARIKELQKRESGLQQEINTLVEKKIAVDEENVFLKKELSDLQKKFKDQSQELKNTKERVQKKEEKNILIIKELEEENKELSIRCAELLNDLENLRKQETQWKKEKHDIDCKMKISAADLIEAKRKIEESRLKCKELTFQLNQKQAEIKQKDVDIILVNKELQELQNFYQQNQEHTAHQAELIRQLHVLNMDTQKVLRNQEDAHTVESISYQKLYHELLINFEAKKATESLLRKNIICLKDQLVQKDQDIMQLTEKINEFEKTSHLVTRTIFLNNMEQEFQQPSLSSLETMMVSQKSEIDFLQEKLKIANVKLSEKSSSTSIHIGSIISGFGRIYEEPPVKRSRSLSPKTCFKDSKDLKRLKAAERKIENLEKTLQLKIQENDELRDAHEKRKERMQMLQTNYRAVKEQLKQLEENYSKTDRNKQMRRRESQQFLQEDSNALWNELIYFKREHQKLLIENVNLEEELDQLRVFKSMELAKMQEVNAYLEQEREDLLYRLCEDQEVKNDTSEEKLKQKSDETLQKVTDLEKRLKDFEKKSRKLKEANKKLTQENDEMKSSCKQQQDDAEAKEEELTHLRKEKEDVERDRAILEFKIRELEVETKAGRQQIVEVKFLNEQVAEVNFLKEQGVEVNSLKERMAEINKMRKENEKLRIQVQEIEDTNQIQKTHQIQEMQRMQRMQEMQQMQNMQCMKEMQSVEPRQAIQPLLQTPKQPLVQLPAQLSAQAPVQVPAQLPAQLPTQLPVQLPIQLTAQLPAQISTQLPARLPTQLPTQLPAQLPAQIPTRLPTRLPAQLLTQLPAQLPVQIPTQLPARLPAQLPTQLPVQLPIQLSAQLPAQLPVQLPTQIPAQLPAQLPAQPSPQLLAQLPTQIPAQLPTQPPAQLPIQLPTEFPAQLSTHSLVQPPELPAQVQLPAQPLIQLQVEPVQLYLEKAMPKEPILEVVSTEQCRQCKTTTTKVKFKAAKKKGATGHPQAFLNQSIKVMSNMFENYKDDWEDVSESSDSEELISQNLGTIIVKTSQKVSPRKVEGKQTEEQAEGKKQIVLAIENPTKKDSYNKDCRRSFSQKKKIHALRKAYAPATTKVNKENENNVNFAKPVLNERVGSMQQQINMLQDLKKSTEVSIKELKDANEKLTQQQEITDQKLQTTKQTVKKQNSDLVELRKEKEELQKKLETANEAKSVIETSKNMQAEIKQLQCKLKNTTNEMTKLSSDIKSLKCEVKEKEEQIQEFQGKVSRMERDLVMKRHLIEHFKQRQKVNLENNDNFNDLLENLEKKVKGLTEDCSNKKTAIDSLKQMLNVVTKEKSRYEQMYIKAKDELEKKDHKFTHLLNKMSETKSAMTELEAIASQQLHGLALQSERAFETVHIKLMRANDREEEFITFLKGLAKAILHNIQEMRSRIRHIKKIRHNKTFTKTSTQKVQCLAASILNISPTDVEEMLDSEDEEELKKAKRACEQDKEWLRYINKILEEQFPFAARLLEAIMEKINEKKKLVEEYIKFMKAVG